MYRKCEECFMKYHFSSITPTFWGGGGVFKLGVLRPCHEHSPNIGTNQEAYIGIKGVTILVDVTREFNNFKQQ